MTRVIIRQFRAALADPANASGALRAYREIARRPHAGLWAAALPVWSEWPPSAASARETGVRLAGWATGPRRPPTPTRPDPVPGIAVSGAGGGPFILQPGRP
ncbi:hypothetical protein SAMN05216486_10612 [bacterium JGI 053]|nr:hypothetical protein SAMN05216486_10612 [bacterium JGI 053]